MAIPAGVTKWKKIFLPNISSTFSKFSKPINIRNSFLPQQRQLSLFSPKLCQESEQQNQARRSILVFLNNLNNNDINLMKLNFLFLLGSL